jgi:hypothetical protein
MKKHLLFVTVILSLMIVFSVTNWSLAQTQRNPVLEEFTGTWCPWCPCGHDIMEDIVAAIPNAIMIGYHGPANGSDPFSFFSGNSVISMLSPPFWPSGTPDRTGAPDSRGLWMGQMTARNSVPATVAIDVSRTFNSTTREFSATIDFTALTNLNGQYMFTVILLESGMVWNQAGNGSCPGAANYVHNHVVRDMMNGAVGEEIINGAWNASDVITKTVNRTIPTPGGSGPDMVWDNCDIVVMVHEQGSPLYNGEIQQAEEMTLISPDYLATISSTSPDIIGDNTAPGQFTAMIHNIGLMDDMYYIDCTLDAPTGWTGDFTTTNGTFPFGDTDSVQVATGDSTEVSITINPNLISGSGEATLEFQSKNNPGNTGSVTVRLVTTTGVDILVVDASADGFGEVVANSLQNVYTGTYGVVSRSALHATGVNLSSFYFISWSAGVTVPAFYPEEVTALENYLTNGGRLFINGQDIGADIFEPTGQSQFAQSFYNNYLHTNYESNTSNSFLLNGYAGDPITDGISFVLNFVYDKSPESISPFDSDATPIFLYLNGPLMGGIRAETDDYRVVYFGIGLEQIDDGAIRDTLIARTINWLKEGFIFPGVNNEINLLSYSLEQNYPNPFNPSTKISYSLVEEVEVNLKVYDVMGREVAQLVSEKQPAGYYTHNFDASALSSGIYFYKLTAGDFISVKKMTLLK